jgi:hypothetical protein
MIYLLQKYVEQNTCVYCHHTFKDYDAMKLHMRKKKHFRFHPKDHEWDRFFILNYTV